MVAFAKRIRIGWILTRSFKLWASCLAKLDVGVIQLIKVRLGITYSVST